MDDAHDLAESFDQPLAAGVELEREELANLSRHAVRARVLPAQEHSADRQVLRVGGEELIERAEAQPHDEVEPRARVTAPIGSRTRFFRG